MAQVTELTFKAITIIPAAATFFKCCSCGRKTRVSAHGQYKASYEIEEGHNHVFFSCSKACVANFFMLRRDYYNAYMNKELANAAAKHYGENKAALLEFLKKLNP